MDKLKKIIGYVTEKWKNRKGFSIKSKLEYINQKYITVCFFTSFILTYVIEAMSRHSIFEPIVFLFQNPIMFVYNAAILFLVMSVGCAIRRRVLYFGVSTIMILALGITNGVLLSMRITPFAAVDITLVKSAMLIINTYFSPVLLALLVIAVLLVLLVAIFIGMKTPKYEGKMYRLLAAGLIAVYCLSLLGLENVLFRIGVTKENFSNLADSYKNYGLAYCFTNSIIKLGMDEPDNYSVEVIEAIVDEKLKDKFPVEVSMNATGTASDNTATVSENIATPVVESVSADVLLKEKEWEEKKKSPNIIFLQLESFFDPTEVDGLEFSEDPVPNFRELKLKYSSGRLFVPSVGAGTANTEFEVITGMNLDFFGPGEYPYKTILKSTTCESTAYVLKEIDYATHAIHNNDGTFYDRNIVFSQLGFDTFTPIEYMYNKETNINNYAKDEMLVDEIVDTLDSTSIQDYIYTISVQAHGEYPTERLGEEEPVFVRYKDQSRENAWSYYINQIHEVDQFIKDLTDELGKRKEPTVLVMYGDHLPNMGLTNTDVASNRLTATEYVIWDNFDMDVEDKDVESYQLTSHVLEKCGIEAGVMNQFHQNSSEDEGYLEELEVLQYDMLYGEHEIFGGVNPFVPTPLQMGIRNIKINSISQLNNEIWIYGNYFNTYSIVFRNGEQLDTVYMDENALCVSGITAEEGDVFTVAQIGDDDFILGQTPGYIYQTADQE